MDTRTRCEASRVTFLQSNRAVLESNRSVFEMRLAIVATVNRIHRTMELLDGCARDGRSRFVITNLDAAVARLSAMTSSAVGTVKESEGAVQLEAVA